MFRSLGFASGTAGRSFGEIRSPQFHAIAVLEDFHLLGKSIIYSSLKGLGFRVLDFEQCNVDELIKKTTQNYLYHKSIYHWELLEL